MRTTPVMRSLAAVLVSGGIVVAVAGAAEAAAPATYPTGHGGGGGSNSPVWGTVVSSGELNVRDQPTTNSSVVDALSPGSQDRVQCAVRGQTVRGNPYWYWLVGAQGWASAAFVDTGGQGVPSCSDPCPGWRDGGNSNDHNSGWNDPSWRDGNSSWSSSASGTFDISGSWSWSSAGSSSGSDGIWQWAPGGH
ncbi:hypothetical protein OK074_3243 [Actinobacteria bacterium OK074]|nr:hypothetical protein OK074_3243 [Actinobacteria bacterium OK074]